ncbi:MAG: class I SAM-dependent DNA methyltransferase [Gemmatimonas sp.]
MNAVEIEEAVSALFEQPFDAAEFPYQFLDAFGNNTTTIQKLRKGGSNRSDVGGVLQVNNIHLAVAAPSEVTATLQQLRESPATTRHKTKFILATDGETVEAEEVGGTDVVSCAYADLPNHFGFFLALAGITTVRQIRENAFDIRATSRLNRLYVELLKTNPEWGTEARRHDMNHFMARLIFSFFAEDTDIFGADVRFTDTVTTMSAKDSSNTHEVIGALFTAMNTRKEDREREGIPRWAMPFPYVNGGLFSGNMDVPRFSKIARSYLAHIGSLDWTRINPDIFGSMIQAVADDDERGALGMHYTSVPNILKVLNPLFLDDLREKLASAGDNARTLLNLRKRMARIRVFDPACGSGNFLVIAYKEMREIEAEINKRRGEPTRSSEIPLTNFRGIELRDFPAEIARLALIIAEYQCDVLYRGKTFALAEFLPLNAENWIVSGNALQLDWSALCPSEGSGVKLHAHDLFQTPLDQSEINFEYAAGETYVCGNPPYSGKGKKEAAQQADMADVFRNRTSQYGYVDYVGCWFVLAGDYCRVTGASAAFVATNSICQGRQLPQLWPVVLASDLEIVFAHRSFKWSNSAVNNAGVTCVIVAIAQKTRSLRKVIYDETTSRSVRNINAYLIDGPDTVVESSPAHIGAVLPKMQTGSVPNDGGQLLLSVSDAADLVREFPPTARYVHPFFGSQDFLQGQSRKCLVIPDADVKAANAIPTIRERLRRVAELRMASPKKETREILARTPNRFQHRAPIAEETVVIVPSVCSERRNWFPAGLLPAGTVVSNLAFMIVDEPLWNLSLITSALHLVWIGTVCGKLKTDYRYSNTLGWNTFPVPTLTEKNMADLTQCAQDIVLAREAHFPATIADLYDPDQMPSDLLDAHDRNDEVLERIYIGRRFKNDTERLEKLFDMYSKVAATAPASKKPSKKRAG